jgi:hypothetical protein
VTGQERSAADVIDQRLALFRSVLEACAADGFDPGGVTLTSYRAGDVEFFPSHPYPREEQALALLARLTDSDWARADLGNSSSYRAGGVTVYAELHPDASRDEDATPGPEAAR